MEYINPANAPINMVDDAVFHLRRLSNLCFLLSHLQDRQDEVDLDIIGDAMGVVMDCLDTQIKALDSINWNAGKAVTA